MKESGTTEATQAARVEAQLPRLWLSVEETSPVVGDPPHKIYRDIREGQFPFEFKRIGKRIKISARSLGLVGADAAAA